MLKSPQVTPQPKHYISSFKKVSLQEPWITQKAVSLPLFYGTMKTYFMFHLIWTLDINLRLNIET